MFYYVFKKNTKICLLTKRTDHRIHIFFQRNCQSFFGTIRTFSKTTHDSYFTPKLLNMDLNYFLKLFFGKDEKLKYRGFKTRFL